MKISAKLFLLLLLSWVLLASPAEAHRPYVSELGDGFDYKGEKYRLAGWYGDGILLADPVTPVVLNEKGDLVAVSEVIGSWVASYCPSVDRCWVFTGGLPFIPIISRVEPEAFRVSESSLNKSDLVYPDDYKGERYGFSGSWDAWLIPLAWYKSLQATAHPLVVGLSLATFLLFSFVCAIQKLLLRYVIKNTTGNKVMRVIFKTLNVFVLAITGAFFCVSALDVWYLLILLASMTVTLLISRTIAAKPAL